jgi:hypothetical protein
LESSQAYFIESEHPVYVEIKATGGLSPGQLEFLNYLYRFYPCTPNELIQKVQAERRSENPLEVVGLNKHPKLLKDNGTIRVVETRKCSVSGNTSQVLAPTFNLPCPKGMTIFADRYLIESAKTISIGMGVVLFGTDQQTLQSVVIKQCTEKHPGLLKRFRTEVGLMQKFQNHQEVVDIIVSNLEHEPPYFVMPVADGGDLSKHVTRLKGNFSLQQNIFTQMLSCVELLHSENVIHRDIKPQNFLVFADDVVKVIDFGVSRESEDDTSTRVTMTGAQGGTEQFAPPEFYDPSGFKCASPAWDIFSLGKTFYSLMTGRHSRFMRNEGDLPEFLFDVLKKSADEVPEKRFQSIAELKHALSRAYDQINNLEIQEAQGASA